MKVFTWNEIRRIGMAALIGFLLVLSSVVPAAAYTQFYGGQAGVKNFTLSYNPTTFDTASDPLNVIVKVPFKIGKVSGRTLSEYQYEFKVTYNGKTYTGHSSSKLGSGDTWTLTFKIAKGTAQTAIAAKTMTMWGRVYHPSDPYAWNPSGGGTQSISKKTIPAKTSYTVTYHANGGTKAPASQTKWHGTDLTLSSGKPVKSGYVFAGWNTKADGSGSNYSAGGKYKANAAVTLYAKWTAIPASVTVRYHANGGSLADPNGGGYFIDTDGAISRNGTDLTTTAGGNSAIRLAEMNNPEQLHLAREGYHVVQDQEWNTEADGSGETYGQNHSYPAGNFGSEAVLYVNWIRNSYTIRYHGKSEADGYDEDVRGFMPDQTLLYGSAVHLESNSYVRSGYRLRGWSLDARGTDPLILDEGLVSNLAVKEGEQIDLYAVWEPIEADQADIIVGKTLTTGGSIDTFAFLIEPVEGWTQENESTRESGVTLDAGQMPMPEGTDPDEGYKRIEITGFSGNPNVLRTKSAGLIRFEKPGWYLYRLREEIPENPAEGVRYDDSSYYAAIYVEYRGEENHKVAVKNITAWHNSGGSQKNRPDLRDIAAITDNGSAAARANDGKGVFGKVGIGTNSLDAFQFWNTQQGGSFRLMKNVTGSLGDRTKQFEFTLSFTHLGSNAAYPVSCDGAIAVSGWNGGWFRSDAEGNAVLKLKLRDDEVFEFDNLPVGATFRVTEGASDHRPSYEVSTQQGGLLFSGEGERDGESLATEVVPVTSMDTYSVLFENDRNLTVNTGVSGIPAPLAANCLLMAGILLLLFLPHSERRR